MPSHLRTPEEAHAAIQRFLSASKEPALLEPGEEQIMLGPENCVVELRSGRLTIQAWDERRNLTRVVSGIKSEEAGRLELIAERFGKQTGTLQLLDVARRRGLTASQRGGRQAFREHLRRSLTRQFPGWTVRDLSSEPDLEHSLSPAFPRALVTRGSAGWAVIGAPAQSPAPEGALTFGLIWLDYLRRRERRVHIEGLCLFLPSGREKAACLRTLHLNRADTGYRVFAYEDSYEAELDLGDYGNIETTIPARPAAASGPDASADALIEQLRSEPGIETVGTPDGGRSLRVRGLEIAREHGGRFEFGLETKRKAGASHLREIAELAREVGRMRSADYPDPGNELYRRNPELWLESQVRAHLETIDAALLPSPVYGQVPALAGPDRGVIDLLACDVSGRLKILELKASEDPHLPLQALDYWIRVNWHRERDDFRRAGYFPGVPLANVPPALLLVAPALQFHPATGIVLRFLRPDLEVERVGLSEDWRRGLKVMFRMKGTETR